MAVARPGFKLQFSWGPLPKKGPQVGCFQGLDPGPWLLRGWLGWCRQVPVRSALSLAGHFQSCRE
jgi:hypothetical protein